MDSSFSLWNILYTILHLASAISCGFSSRDLWIKIKTNPQVFFGWLLITAFIPFHISQLSITVFSSLLLQDPSDAKTLYYMYIYDVLVLSMNSLLITGIFFYLNLALKLTSFAVAKPKFLLKIVESRVFLLAILSGLLILTAIEIPLQGFGYKMAIASLISCESFALLILMFSAISILLVLARIFNNYLTPATSEVSGGAKFGEEDSPERTLLRFLAISMIFFIITEQSLQGDLVDFNRVMSNGALFNDKWRNPYFDYVQFLYSLPGLIATFVFARNSRNARVTPMEKRTSSVKPERESRSKSKDIKGDDSGISSIELRKIESD